MSRPMGVFKTENDYQKLISRDVYERTPKAVFAALFVSLSLNMIGTEAGKIDEHILEEWMTLHEQGIIPQKPIKK